MPSIEEKRKKNKVVTKPAQLAGLGVIPPTEDKEGNKIVIQPTVIQRPNALSSKAFAGGGIGASIPMKGLADRAIAANQAGANNTDSGMPDSGLSSEEKKKKKGLL